MRKIPHLFSKVMVVWCVGMGALCSLIALHIFWQSGQEAAGLLTPILAFFGGDLALMFGRSALQKQNRKEENEDGYYQHS